MTKDNLGDRMKSYELTETGRKFDPACPVYARIDGRGFSKFTKGMKRPFDYDMTSAMIETTMYLVEQTHARVGYVQSDEISLVWDVTDSDKENPELPFFNGKIQKMTSVLASMAASFFILSIPEKYRYRMPHFDCRACQLPSKVEAANMLLWRALDAQRNSIFMAAQHNVERRFQGVSQAGMLDMLQSTGIDFHNYGPYVPQFKYGTFVRRLTVERYLELEEMVSIPEDKRPTGKVIRNDICLTSVRDFNKVANRVEFLFDGEDYRYENDSKN